MPMVIALLTLTLVGSPARSGQDPDPVSPLVTVFAVGTLLNYDRAAQHYRLYLGKEEMITGARRDESSAGSSGQDFQHNYYSRL